MRLPAAAAAAGDSVNGNYANTTSFVWRSVFFYDTTALAADTRMKWKLKFNIFQFNARVRQTPDGDLYVARFMQISAYAHISSQQTGLLWPRMPSDDNDNDDDVTCPFTGRL